MALAVGTFKRKSDNLVKYTGLKDELTGSYVNDATVLADIKNADGGDIQLALALTYVSGSDGDYAGTLQSSVNDLTAVNRVLIEVTITAPGGLDLFDSGEAPVRD